MHKSIPFEDDDVGDVPPSYIESQTSNLLTTASSSTPSPNLFTAHLSAHLSSLPSQIRSSQQVRETHQQLQDLHLLSRVTPHVEQFLADIATGTAGPAGPSRRAELTLVPTTAVPETEGWTLSGIDDDLRDGELRRVARVNCGERETEKGDGGGVGDGPEASISKELSDLSLSFAGAAPKRADLWWWTNEGMAVRLTRILQPHQQTTQQVPKLGRQSIKVAARQAKDARTSGWSIFKSSASNTVSTMSPANSASTSSLKAASGADIDERAIMTVRAEEVAFRRENTFGVWESARGWGIVVRVRVKRTEGN